MRYITALWGSDFWDNHLDEIDNLLRNNPNILVYVWGDYNLTRLKDKYGSIETVLMSSLVCDNSYGESYPSYNFYGHKIHAIHESLSTYDEIIYLDFDIIHNPLSDYPINEFHKSLSSGSELQFSIYSYTDELIESIFKSEDWLNKSIACINWELQFRINIYKYARSVFYNKGVKNYMLPNAGFIYCRSKEVTGEILRYISINQELCLADEYGLLHAYNLMYGEFNLDTYFKLNRHVYCVGHDIDRGTMISHIIDSGYSINLIEQFIHK